MATWSLNFILQNILSRSNACLQHGDSENVIVEHTEKSYS